MKRAWPLVTVAVLGVATRFAYFGHPREVVLDEVLVGKFVSSYFTHTVVFDSHPALAKLLVAGFAALCGWRPGFTFDHIGQVYPDGQHLILRFLPSLAGALLPIVVWLLARELRFGRLAATTAGLLVVFENGLLTESRFLFPDIFLLLFGFGALSFYFRSARDGGAEALPCEGEGRDGGIEAPPFRSAREGAAEGVHDGPETRGQAGDVTAESGAGSDTAMKPLGAADRVSHRRRRWPWLVAAGLCAGCAASVKWTGLTFLALPVIVEATSAIRQRRLSLFGGIAALLIIALAVYAAVTAVHVSLTIAAVQPPVLGPRGIVPNMLTLNRDMFNSNRNLTVGHPYGSAWYTWPLMLRPLYCWNSAMAAAAGSPAPPALARIYLLGNPFVWWGSSVAVVVLLVGLVLRWFEWDRTALVLGGGYLVNLLPFVAIRRVMFLYHYFPALIFAILILAYVIDRTPAPRRSHAAVTTAALLAFLFFVPLSYGLPLSEAAYNARAWLGSWR